MAVVREDFRSAAPFTAGEEPGRSRLPANTRYAGLALMGCGAALVVWIGMLATSLPTTAHVPHWSALWMGLDALEALGLITTGVLLLRRDPRRCLTAAATAALLVVDAWFDILTSLSRPELATALAMALGAELPLATLCVVLAVRALRQHEDAHSRSRTRTL